MHKVVRDPSHNLRGERKTPDDGFDQDIWTRRLVSRIQIDSWSKLSSKLGLTKLVK